MLFKRFFVLNVMPVRGDTFDVVERWVTLFFVHFQSYIVLFYP